MCVNCTLRLLQRQSLQRAVALSLIGENYNRELAHSFYCVAGWASITNEVKSHFARSSERRVYRCIYAYISVCVYKSLVGVIVFCPRAV